MFVFRVAVSVNYNPVAVDKLFGECGVVRIVGGLFISGCGERHYLIRGVWGQYKRTNGTPVCVTTPTFLRVGEKRVPPVPEKRQSNVSVWRFL